MNDPLYFIPADETVFWSAQPVTKKTPAAKVSKNNPVTWFAVFWLVGTTLTAVASMLGARGNFFSIFTSIPVYAIFTSVGVMLFRLGTGIQSVEDEDVWYAVTDKAAYYSSRMGWHSLRYMKGAAAYARPTPDGAGIVTIIFGPDQLEFKAVEDCEEVCTIINDAIMEAV